MNLHVLIAKKGDHDLPLPAYAHEGDSGMHLHANVRAMGVGGSRWARRGDEVTIRPGGRAVIPCGFAFAIPRGFEGQVRPRSGRSSNERYPLVIVGTIDASYRGEVGIIVANTDVYDVFLRHGERIAQLVVAPVAQVDLTLVEKLPDDTTRGEAGYGSTGG